MGRLGWVGWHHRRTGNRSPWRRWRRALLWLLAAEGAGLSACGGGGGDGSGAAPPQDPTTGALYVGYYIEDAADNPEDPTVGAVMLRLPASDGAFAGQMPFSYAGCAAGSDVGAVRGTRSGSQFSGSWSGTMDGAAVGGGFALAPDAAASGSYSGQWRNAAGKQRITVGGCTYHVASSGAVTLYPGNASVPAGVALTVSTSTTPTIGWSGLPSGVRATLRLFDQACLAADASDAACFLGEASTTATSLAYPAGFGSATALTAGRSYLWVLTAQATNGAFAGFATRTVQAVAADPTPAPGPGPGDGSDGAVRGRLTVSGSGAAALGGEFVAGADANGVSVIVVPTGPVCMPLSGGMRCSSTLSIGWTEWNGSLRREFVGMAFRSVSDGEPGPQPGTAVTAGDVAVSTADGRVTFSQSCDTAARTAPCATLADLGIALDPVARSVTFTNVVLPSQGSDAATIVLDGTLSY
ncbi:MAG TPA: hypothetical protein PLL72_23050 [Burkholderiaceae bacterium]|nr:hypothetical protein [Burkholderiaceae bacterium]